MGFLGFLKKGKKPALETTISDNASHENAVAGEEVALADVMAAIIASREKWLAEERKRAKTLHGKILDEFASVRKLAESLGKEKFEADDKTYAVVNMLKDNYTKKASSLLSNPPRINDYNYEEIAGFSASVKKTLAELLNIPPKQAVLLTRYFKKDASKIILRLKEADVAHMELSSLLNGSDLHLYSRIDAGVRTVGEMAAKVMDFDASLNGLGGRMEGKQEELGGKKQNASAFLESEESRNHHALENEIKRMEGERDSLAGKLGDELSPLKRPAKKLEHSLANDAKAKEKKELYSKIAHSPLKVMLSDGDAAIADVLARLRETNLKDEDKEHVEELTKKIELGYLSELADKYKWLENEIADKKAQLDKSPFPEKRMKNEREVDSAGHELAEMKREHERLSRARSEAMEKARAEKRRLEELIERQAKIKLKINLGVV
ncbi:MAG: hypothetical protein NTU57_01960 [Candidatus Aenigmarchaeota archaeon]|nr:hypothetical protein [Candidatus Aenigmarchaeota archaeon]